MPNLISRRQFNARRKLTARLAEEIRKNAAVAIDEAGDVFRIGFKPVKVCQNARANRCAMGRGNPDAASGWGYCASQGMHYYGYKLHAVCGIRGVAHSYGITAASAHDLHYLKDVKWQYHDCTLLEDKGYLSAQVQLNLFDAANITLEVPYRMNQKNWRPPTWAYKPFRKRIETVFPQLNDNLMMIRSYAKSLAGFLPEWQVKSPLWHSCNMLISLIIVPLGQIKYSLF